MHVCRAFGKVNRESRDVRLGSAPVGLSRRLDREAVEEWGESRMRRTGTQKAALFREHYTGSNGSFDPAAARSRIRPLSTIRWVGVPVFLAVLPISRYSVRPK